VIANVTSAFDPFRTFGLRRGWSGQGHRGFVERYPANSMPGVLSIHKLNSQILMPKMTCQRGGPGSVAEPNFCFQLLT
jgi:hypothetical protein